VQRTRQRSFVSLLNPGEVITTLWRHRSLLWQFTVRNLEMRHRGSILGALWAVLNPLSMLAVYVFVFGYVFGGAFSRGDATRTGWDYGLGVFLGLAIFHVVSEALAAAPGIVVGQPNYVKKVIFPLEILPAAAVGSSVIHMFVTLAMVLVGSLFGSVAPSWHLLWLPVIILPIVAMSLSLAWMVAALGVFFRDVSQLVGALITIIMFASAIFYPVESIPPAAWTVLQFNPLIHTLEMARGVLLWHQPPGLAPLAVLYVASFVAVVLGFAVFARLKRAFADVI
jgi:lipopolysaccharide transport system permease protein